jgi:ATP-binding cassette subfamily B multidrug efflux pump
MFRFFENLVDPFQPYAAETPPSGVRAYVVEHLRPLRHVIAMSLGFTVLGALIEIWLVYYAGRLVDTLATTPPAELWSRLGVELLTVAAILLVLRPAAAFMRESLDDIAFRPNAVSLMRWRAHRHVLRQSVGWFRNEHSGRLATRVRELGVSGTGAAYAVIHTLAYVAVYIAGSFWLMASVDVRLALPLAIWAALYLIHMSYAVPRFRDSSERFQNALTELTSLFVDTYANIDTIKLFADQSHEDAESEKRFRAARSTFIGVQRFEVIINVGMVVLGNLLLVGLVGYAIVLWQAGDAPLGIVAAALALSIRISSMADWMLDAVSSLFGWIGSTREALKSVAQPLDIIDAPNAAPLHLSDGAIRFDGVTHRYGGGTDGLDNVSLDIAAGEKVGLVGPSGAGKSTVVNLLLRFFEPERGTISIDGQDIFRVTQESLRRQIAMVAQDPALLHRSISDNIAYGRQGVTRAEIEAAARKAEAADFIATLQDRDGNEGYDTVIGERGIRLSGGQRQRIALARAILKDAPILVLDEATSALDSEVEAAILETLYGVMQGKTVIAIAHRLSTIAHMDRIAVLDAGRILELGTHDELLLNNGLYARLWARQSGGFLGS